MAFGLGGNLWTLRLSPNCVGIFLLAEGLVLQSHHTSFSLMCGTYVAFPWKESFGQQCGNVVKGRGTKHWLLSQPCCRP